MPRKVGSDSRIIARYGDWYIVRRDGSSALYRARIRRGTNTEERFSLRTADLAEARRRLVEWLDSQYRPLQAQPADVALAWVIGNYYAEHGSKVRSAERVRGELKFWLDWWGEAMVGDMSSDRIESFIEWVRQHRTSDGHPFSSGYVARILTAGRAALNRAKRRNMLLAVPFIPAAQTADEKREAPPRGRPLTAADVAQLLDAIPDDSEHLWRLCVIMICTMCRPEAARELTSDQVDLAAGIIRLNPEGRRQTKKRRPMVPICGTLRLWLERWGSGLYISRRSGAPIASTKSAWWALRARVWPLDQSELPEPTTRAEKQARRLMCGPRGQDVQPYSIRHTMGRVLRRARVSGEEISIMLGHRVVGGNDVTEIYSPYDPDYCQAAVEAIDAFCLEVSRLQCGPRRLVIEETALRVILDYRKIR